MGRELQKRKNRSSTSKATLKPKSKKHLLRNAIIAANWDDSQTLSQNYRRLGLAAKLNKSTGGVERTTADVLRQDNAEAHVDTRAKGDSLRIQSIKAREEKLDIHEVEIERDPQTGAIIRVLGGDEEQKKPNPLNDPLNDLDSDSESETAERTLPTTDVVRQLEQQASLPEKKHRRKQSEAEIAFIEQLVRKYGDDVPKMARDIKINYMQRSEADLRQRIKKWASNGGSV
ncbi:nucleolar protein 16 [Polychaeton citri CBS 116435]|uniref:Nucleolar protein 16 n=1 Tax=Polychaeton citri CBS 116435 TaxID=1314669 RepID=A0A9P4UPL3_9PEZI|nr:nucleolar protein 16 [Polychaeton citri CBS 116435]